MSTATNPAFGGPGIPPTFAAGDKDVVGTALGTSRVWLTIGGGVLNEVFWPTTGRPQLRDLGFLVTGTGFWTEVKRVADYTVSQPSPSVPLPTIVHTHERYELTVEFVCDPRRDCVLVRYRLDDRSATPDPALALHVLVAPHVGGSGHGNSAWVDRGTLMAARGAEALALVADPPYRSLSVGYVGSSDGWQDVALHGAPIWTFTEAPDGNVALTGSLPAAGTLALGFGSTGDGARSLAAASLVEGFDALATAYRADWESWSSHLDLPEGDPRHVALARTSAMVLRVHEDLTFPGATVASLATPWGIAHDDPGGYHLVWPRDCAETGLALAALGMVDDARRMLEFLAATQSADGHWPQNFTPDGIAYWSGVQLDETALPLVLAAKLRELGYLDGGLDERLAPMVRRAVAYVAANGPLTQQDRWEEAAGASPFTLAATVASLVGIAASGWLTDAEAAYARSLADWWNHRIEDLVYVEGSQIDTRFGTPGHYVRIGRDETDGSDGNRGKLLLANRGGETYALRELVGMEFLALVRYGLRAGDDPRIVATVRLIDGTLRANGPGGPLYYRYQDDGYGEHADGSPFDGTGIGRLWPLLAGERGNYAAEAGEDPTPYLQSMAASVSLGNLLPEQVWDAPAVPARRLVPGRPTGSAMPLVWAHAEFVKLFLVAGGRPCADRLTAVAERYASTPALVTAHVRTERVHRMITPEVLIESSRPFVLHLGHDGWQDAHDLPSAPIAFGMHGVRLRRTELPNGASTVDWTRFDPATKAWEGVDHVLVM